ncbi:hypothetical protein X975_17361, partial [Stegodyphus mimosarum]
MLAHMLKSFQISNICMMLMFNLINSFFRTLEILRSSEKKLLLKHALFHFFGRQGVTCVVKHPSIHVRYWCGVLE